MSVTLKSEQKSGRVEDDHHDTEGDQGTTDTAGKGDEQTVAAAFPDNAHVTKAASDKNRDDSQNDESCPASNCMLDNISVVQMTSVNVFDLVEFHLKDNTD